MEFKLPKIVKSDYDGYSCLIDYHKKVSNCLDKNITLDFEQTTWFDGNLCAVLGAIHSKAREKNISVKCVKTNKDISETFSENGFLQKTGTIYFPGANRYSDLNATEEKVLAGYVDELLAIPLLPYMTDLLKRKINRSILEIFNNAINHGRSGSICSCGQFYPKAQRLNFTIVDLGHTIRRNVRDYLRNSKVSARQAIEWAVFKGNTTRTGNIPGGLGFSLIRDFLKLNGGSIEIVSSNGFWKEENDAIFVREFDRHFIGTIVNLEFNLNDTNSYDWVDETESQPLF